MDFGTLSIIVLTLGFAIVISYGAYILVND